MLYKSLTFTFLIIPLFTITLSSPLHAQEKIISIDSQFVVDPDTYEEQLKITTTYANGTSETEFKIGDFKKVYDIETVMLSSIESKKQKKEYPYENDKINEYCYFFKWGNIELNFHQQEYEFTLNEMQEAFENRMTLFVNHGCPEGDLKKFLVTVVPNKPSGIEPFQFNIDQRVNDANEYVCLLTENSLIYIENIRIQPKGIWCFPGRYKSILIKVK